MYQVSNRQALGGVGGFLTGAMAPMAQREADVYERIRATQRPEEQRAQLALEERSSCTRTHRSTYSTVWWFS